MKYGGGGLVAKLCLTLETPWTVACQAPLSMGILQAKNSRVGCDALLQGIFPAQGLNTGLPHCRQILYYLNQQGSPNSNQFWGAEKALASIINYWHGSSQILKNNR